MAVGKALGGRTSDRYQVAMFFRAWINWSTPASLVAQEVTRRMLEWVSSTFPFISKVKSSASFRITWSGKTGKSWLVRESEANEYHCSAMAVRSFSAIWLLWRARS